VPAATFGELIATHPAVTPAQRARWLALIETGTKRLDGEGG
jgi:hypothetical protein